jgi:hypothetical protein
MPSPVVPVEDSPLRLAPALPVELNVLLRRR